MTSCGSEPKGWKSLLLTLERMLQFKFLLNRRIFINAVKWWVMSISVKYLSKVDRAFGLEVSPTVMVIPKNWIKSYRLHIDEPDRAHAVWQHPQTKGVCACVCSRSHTWHNASWLEVDQTCFSGGWLLLYMISAVLGQSSEYFCFILVEGPWENVVLQFVS